MAEYGGWRASIDRTATLPVGTISWSGTAAAGRSTGALPDRKAAAMPVGYRIVAMMLAVFLALRSRH